MSISRILKFQSSVLLLAAIITTVGGNSDSERCRGGGQQLKYLWGDALVDSPTCTGPNDMPYPLSQIRRAFSRRDSVWSSLKTGSSRTGRTFNPVDPMLTRHALLKTYNMVNDNNNVFMTNENSNAGQFSGRSGREFGSARNDNSVCQATPSRLCKTRYNTTAPMYGVSLTSGQPVTIVQKFPDLLQQVVYEVCESNECDVVRGECTQTYVPYLFLVIPLGPVTLTGQDYILVESGCVCKPKYATTGNTVSTSPSPLSSSASSTKSGSLSHITSGHNIKSFPPQT
ncbi:uncharacterized protein LOC142331286 isoform X2 [Lycorma delicatula]|uniref:uncharacterized protein LOC142331286 isoform X2 n=1 Tax=Lycorma delicatula TaxID=130591 RepID=UPI003F515877